MDVTPQKRPAHRRRDVYVSPRHLATATGSGDPALVPLLGLGWDVEHDDLANAYVHAPDYTFRLGFLPEGADDGLWRINAYKDPLAPPTWGICFNDGCPTEFVTAFATALATAYQQGPDAYIAGPDTISEHRQPFLAVVPLIQRGWQLDHGSRRNPLAHRLAWLEFTTGDLDAKAELTTRDARWQLWAGTSSDRPNSNTPGQPPPCTPTSPPPSVSRTGCWSGAGGPSRP